MRQQTAARLVRPQQDFEALGEARCLWKLLERDGSGISESVIDINMASATPYGTTFRSILANKNPSIRIPERCIFRLKGKRKAPDLKMFGARQRNCLLIRSVLDKQKGNTNGSVNGYNTHINGSKDPARIALERLFTQTQKLEKKIMAASHGLKDSKGKYDLNLEGLESDLQAALTALKKKEEDLQAAERAVAVDWRRMESVRKDLDLREKEIIAAQVLQESLEKELDKYREESVVRAEELKKIKHRLNEKETEISSFQFASRTKEEELGRLSRELVNKNEELAKTGAELESKDMLISQASMVMAGQRSEIAELQRVLNEREAELMKSENEKREEQEKLKISEANLEERVVAWFLAQQELKKLAQEVMKYKGSSVATEEELERTRNLLAQVKKELRISQKSIESYRQRLQDQDAELELQRVEFSKQKNKIQSYETFLRHAHMEIKNEREKLQFAEAHRRELEQHLANEREKMDKLQKELQQEKSYLNQSVEEVSSLKKELEKKDASFNDAQTLLQFKESELVVARLEMQRLKSDVAFVQRNLIDKDKDLVVAKENLEGLHEEISQLKGLMRAKEDQLLKAALMLKDKDEQLKIIQSDLDDKKLKFSEAASVVEHIADLTKALVESANEGKSLTMDDDSILLQTNCELYATNRALLERELQLQHIQEKSVEDLRKWEQSEAELGSMKECLRQKEKELLEAHRTLALKDQEIKDFLSKWDVRENELIKMREEVIEEANGLNSLHEIVQKRMGGKTLGDLALEKLELDAAHLEIEAAMRALRNLADLSQKLLVETKTSLYISTDNILLPNNTVDMEVEIEAHKQGVNMSTREDLAALKRRLIERDAEIKRTQVAVRELSTLTKQLISEAGIKSFENTNKVEKAADKEMTANKLKTYAV